MGFSLEYARLDDLTGTYSGDGSFDNQGNLSAAVYQEVVFTGGLPTQKGWRIAESVVSTVTMNHLGNNRYQIGLDVHLEDPDEILPDVDITGRYTADFTGEFN